MHDWLIVQSALLLQAPGSEAGQPANGSETVKKNARRRFKEYLWKNETVRSS
jgi:hypothetical protein